MATVAFPTGYYIERSSVIQHSNNVEVDIMDDGTPRQRVLGTTQHVTISCEIKYLTDTEKDTLTAFMEDNAANTITWTIDGVDYSGVFVGGYRRTMTGNRHNLRFKYYASEV